ncbi:hypothetical protein [Adhaeribacter soli]|uniref:Uncharacterized protein n=1 Tax=Adhaeribacter soli TaxID=2607655 RepID=A0A5N1J5Y7_9BACT|nr:hypothetical protein [Adhaeribacter soli]KAA9345583.1 hypothetical protein F0P94_00395 [Adhaeribacter soli]
MPAENKWNDALGKRLYDFEEAPLPETWSKISGELKPRRYRWWLWLPLIPLLISLPWVLKFTVIEKHEVGLEQKNNPKSEENLAFLQPANGTENSPSENKTGSIASNQPAPVSPKELTSGSDQQTNSGNPDKNTVDEIGKNVTPNRQAEKPAYRPLVVIPGVAAIRETEDMEEENSISEKPKKKILSKGLIAHARRKDAKPTLASKSLNPEESKDNTTVPDQKENSGNSVSAGGILQPAIAFNRNAKKDQAGKALNGSPDELKTENNAGFTVQEINSENKENGAATQDSKSSLGELSGLAPVQNEAAKQDSVIKPISLAANLTQDSSENKTRKQPVKTNNKWAFITYGTPQIAYQRVLANRQDNLMVVKMNHMNAYSSERLGYELGLRSRYYLSENLQLEAGLHFGQLTQSINLTTKATLADSAVVQQQPNGSVAMQVHNRQQKQQVIFRYYLGGVYLGANYVLLPKLHFNAGLGANTLLQYKNETEGFDPEITRVAPYVTAGFKYNWQLGRDFTLQAGPVMQYYLQAFQRGNTPISAKPTTFGLSIGIQYRRQK